MEKIEYYTNIKDKVCQIFNKRYKTNFKVQLLTYNLYGINYPESYRKNIEQLNKIGKTMEEQIGFYDPNNKSIIIFYDTLKRIREANFFGNEHDACLTVLIRAILHELEHKLQFEYPDKIDDISELDKFKIDIEKIISNHINGIEDIYTPYHDDFHIEIDADLKSASNAAFIKDSITENTYGTIDESYYQKIGFYSYFREKTYDLPYFISYLNKYIKRFPMLLNPSYKCFSNPTIYEFYNKDGSFKSLSEIMNNERINKLDPMIIASIVCSEDFLKQIKSQQINTNEMYDAYQYLLEKTKLIYKDYVNRILYYRQNIDYIDMSVINLTDKLKKDYKPKNKPEFHEIDHRYYEMIYQKIKMLEESINKIEEYSIPTANAKANKCLTKR